MCLNEIPFDQRVFPYFKICNVDWRISEPTEKMIIIAARAVWAIAKMYKTAKIETDDRILEKMNVFSSKTFSPYSFNDFVMQEEVRSILTQYGGSNCPCFFKLLEFRNEKGREMDIAPQLILSDQQVSDLSKQPYIYSIDALNGAMKHPLSPFGMTFAADLITLLQRQYNAY